MADDERPAGDPRWRRDPTAAPRQGEPPDALRLGPPRAVDQVERRRLPSSNSSSVCPAEHRPRLLGDDVRASPGLRSRRLISSHCGFSPGRVRCSANPPRSFSPCSTNTAWPRVERLRPRDPAALLVVATVPHDHAAVPGAPSKSLWATSWSATSHREALDGGIERGAFRHRPRPHHAAHLQAQIEMVRVAACSCTTNTPALTPRMANCSWPSGGNLGAVQPAHPRSGWPLGRNSRSRSTASAWPLGMHGDRPVGFVAHPPLDLRSARCLIAARKPTPWTAPPMLSLTARVGSLVRVHPLPSHDAAERAPSPDNRGIRVDARWEFFAGIFDHLADFTGWPHSV